MTEVLNGQRETNTNCVNKNKNKLLYNKSGVFKFLFNKSFKYFFCSF